MNKNRTMIPECSAWLLLCMFLIWAPAAGAVTYANTTVAFSWIDASSHTKVGYNTVPYKFNGGGGCGTTPPTLDDTLSDDIPLGFSFMFGGQVFTSVRIMSNGRLQFNNNTTCGYGSPVTQLPYPNASLGYSMRIYGNDLDPTAKSEVPAYNTTCLDRTTCYVSYATLGTAPYRSFVVTWNNVPEWTILGSVAGNYNLQVILQENGEFIYQYGVNTPGPGNITAQVGWEVDSADYDVPAVGYPADNTAIKFYIPRPVAEYRMEQPSWNGTADEAKDTSGNGNHGVRVGTAQTTPSGYLCRGAAIPWNDNVTTIDAVDTGVAVPTALGGAGTITFWYKATNWASNGNQDAQLFDATVADNRWFFMTKRRIDNSNVRLRFVIRDSLGSDRIAETGNLTNAALAGGWVHIGVSWNFNNLLGLNQDHLRIYVNGAQSVQTTFTSLGTISANIGTLHIGDNRSGYIGVSGSGRSADGTIDEFRLYNYEGGLGLVQRDRSQAGSACLSHYAISHAGSGRACEVNPVTITAHDAAHNALLMPNNTTTISLSTGTGQGDWSLVSGYGVLDNGTANDGNATYLFNGEYQVVLGLNHTTPNSVNINVTDGQLVEGGTEDPALTLTACANVARFNACHNYATTSCSTAAGRLYTRLVGSAFASDVAALTAGGAVDAGFTGKAVVSLIARAVAGGVDASNCFAPDYTQTLDNAVTAFTAGRLTVNATVAAPWRDARIKVVCDSTNCPPSGMTWCSGDDFALRPQSLAVASPDANADATGASATATPALAAGNAFSLTATALAGYDGLPKLDAGQVQAHAGAGRNGVAAGAFAAANPVSGVATGNAFSYDDVGYFRFNAGGVYDDDYTAVDPPGTDCSNDFSNTLVGGLVGCKFGNTTATDHFGRFYPHHFDTEVSHGCTAGSYTYSGQTFPLKVTAKNAAGGTTANYAGSFAKTHTYADANGAVGSFNPATLAATGFAAGVGDLTSPAVVSFSYTNKLTAPTTLKVRVTDGEASSATGSEGTTALRSGRLRMQNAFGAETLALPLPLTAEYYTAGGWRQNADDACTALAVPSLSNYKRNLNAGETTPTLANVPLKKGNAGLRLSAPGAGNTGSATVTTTAPGYLQYDWDNNGTHDNNPSAVATFGVNKAGYIFLREAY